MTRGSDSSDQQKSAAAASHYKKYLTGETQFGFYYEIVTGMRFFRELRTDRYRSSRKDNGISDSRSI